MALKKEAKDKMNTKGAKVGTTGKEKTEETVATTNPQDCTSGIGKFFYPNGATYGEWITALESGGGDGKNSNKTSQSPEPKQNGSRDPKKKGDKSSKDKADLKKDKGGEDNPKTPPKTPKKGGVLIEKDVKSKEEQSFEIIPPKEKPKLNRIRQGMGVYIDGDYRYEGEWKDDKMCGQGTFKYASGASYMGTWEMNKYSGNGEYKWADGRSYSGDWRENRMHGRGIYKDQCGQTFVGQFFNGVGPGLLCEIK